MADDPPDEAFEPQPDEPYRGSRLRRRFQIAVALLLVASLVVLAAIEGGGFLIRGDSVDGTERPGARLAVVDATGALTTVDAQGGSTVTYPLAGVAFEFPVWSPDGSQIAALGDGPTGTGLYVFASRTPADAAADPVLIYESADQAPFYVYWTPDSRALTFLTSEPGEIALRFAPADASTEASIVRAGAPMYWDFVDPGRLLVHTGPSGPEGFVGEIAPQGTPFEGIATTPGAFRAPAVSGDGLHRAYVAAGDGTTGEIVLEARDGSRSNRVRVFGPAAVSFSPQGDQLAFIAPDRPGGGALPLPVGPLRVIDPDNSEPRTVLDGSVVAFFWSPGGSEIATLLLEAPDDSVTEAQAPARITLASTQEAAAGLPLRLAFIDVASGSIRAERIVQLSELFVNQVLPFFDQYTLSHRFWSPDGAAIALPIVGAGDITQVVVIPADGSEPHVAATADMGFWSP